MRIQLSLSVLLLCGCLWVIATQAATPPDASETAQAQGTIVTVGADATSCDYTSLQDAIFNASDGSTILVADGLNHLGQNYFIPPAALSFTIRGGFDTCDSSASPSGQTTIDIGGSGRAFTILYNVDAQDPSREINLENLVITGGAGEQGGGVWVTGRPDRLTVNLRNVQISGNTNQGNGGGLEIYLTGDVDNSLAMVHVDDDSRITDNSAVGKGGGVYCENTNPLDNTGQGLYLGSALVAFNAASDGGGIAIDGCFAVRLETGGPIEIVGGAFVQTGGIIGNTADIRGGGLFVENGAIVTVSGGAADNPDHAGMIIANSATVGGGVAVRGGAAIRLDNVFVENNTASVAGGGIRVEGAFFYMSRNQEPGACAPVSGTDTSVLVRPLCSVLKDNHSGGRGGAISATGSAIAGFARTRIEGNIATDEGGALSAGNTTIDTGSAPDIYFENALFNDNSGFGLIWVGNGAVVELFNTTIVDNGTGAIARMATAAGRTADFRAFKSILDHPEPLVQSFGDGTNTADGRCMISQVAFAESGFDSVAYYSRIDPGFANPGNNDFRLSSSSPAIDYCDDQNDPFSNGLDGIDRGEPWTGPPPVSPPNAPGGDYDLGAYEAVFGGDAVFQDRFEQ